VQFARHGRGQFVNRAHDVGEAGLDGAFRVELRGAQHQPAGAPGADAAHDERRDLRRCDAERDLGHREHRVRRRDDAIEHRGQPAAAAHRRTAHDAEGRDRQRHDPLEHAAEVTVVPGRGVMGDGVRPRLGV
jgi:sRNA-binding protein